MARYLLSVHVGADDRPDTMTEDDERRGYARVAQLESEMRAAGALVLSVRLDGPKNAVVVRSTAEETVTTDGPYVESKELIGGFYMVEAPDRDGAVEWAARTSAAIGMPIEVRALWDFAAG